MAIIFFFFLIFELTWDLSGFFKDLVTYSSTLLNYYAASNFLLLLNNADNKRSLIMTRYSTYLTSLWHRLSDIFSLKLRSLEIHINPSHTRKNIFKVTVVKPAMKEKSPIKIRHKIKNLGKHICSEIGPGVYLRPYLRKENIFQLMAATKPSLRDKASCDASSPYLHTQWTEVTNYWIP